MSTPDRRPRPEPTGFSTRAIRAASHAPKVEQTPTSVPIYQASLQADFSDALAAAAATLDGRPVPALAAV